MISFLKTVLILLLVYFGVKFLFRLLSPYLFRYVAKKVSERFEGAFQQNPGTNASHEEEGKVSIDKMPQKKRSSRDTVGEYVEFEELD